MTTSLSPARVEGLQDAFFAIVMTLLVLDLKVPELAAGQSLLDGLREIGPRFFDYILSFLFLGVYWVGHHIQFHYIERTDRFLLWLNLFFLLIVSLLPYTTKLLSHHFDDHLSHLIYGLNVSGIGLLSYAHWHYATQHHRLTDHDLTDDIIGRVKRRILVAPFLSLIGVALGYVHPLLSLLTYVAIPIYYIVPGAVDQYWSQPAVPHDHPELTVTKTTVEEVTVSVD